jgi:hypothetical protein
MSEQLSLFEELDLEAKQAEEKAREAHNAWMAEPVKCLFCGETMRRSWMSTNHGIIFNGWCMKALAYHARNQGKTWTEESAWLTNKGIDVSKSRFDESQWHLENKVSHYDTHYGRCYMEGCE